jgi:hypothetical protein
MIDFEDAVDVCDFKGKVEGVLQVHIQPCNVDGSLPSEEDDMFVEDPADLLGAVPHLAPAAPPWLLLLDVSFRRTVAHSLSLSQVLG